MPCRTAARMVDAPEVPVRGWDALLVVSEAGEALGAPWCLVGSVRFDFGGQDDGRAVYGVEPTLLPVLWCRTGYR